MRGRDLGGFVAEAQKGEVCHIKVRPGYWIEWGRQFEQLQSATKRLEMIVPVALLLIFILLFMAFGSVKDSLLIFSGVPLALTGGIVALWLRTSLSHLGGRRLHRAQRRRRAERRRHDHLHQSAPRRGPPARRRDPQGAMTRLRPVLMTALVAALGFIPMALAHGHRAEVQKPLATVVIGGIVTPRLTLLVLPALYRMFHRHSDLKPDDFHEGNGDKPDEPRTEPQPAH